MVRFPRIGRLNFPRLQESRWRARLRAQRAWWRRRLRVLAGDHEVLFPVAGGGVVAVETLRGGASAGPRIAILHATAGSGHRSAALALARALGDLSPDAVVREVDTLVFASRFYRSTYAQSYNAMAQRAPRLWGALYALWEQQPVNRSAGPARLALDRLALRSLVRVVERESPDAVVCTHFLPIEALSPRRGQGRLRVPLYCVITDFTAHPLWAYPNVDRYFVASDGVAAELVANGVPAARIEVAGIPVDPAFGRRMGREAACARLGLDPHAPIVLVMGGGSGVGPMAELARRLAALAAAPQVVVVCGTNERMRREVEAVAEAHAGRVRALGFTHDIDALLEAADVAVTKAGGLTCSEALVKGTPLVIFRPTPGQEVRNAQYLESGGAAVHADTVETVATTVARWLADPEERRRVSESALRLARPQAAETIARHVLESVTQHTRRAG
ncbi:MAG TPA: glycosyltransferase [Candidatus Acidoferrales bacterium]|nr:glycosyltransferase [Candidatus Acidoferrales bacterium]